MQAGPHFPPELPELLDFLRPDENLYAFLGRIKREQVRTGLPWIDSLVTLRPGHVLEISGPAGSAKTELLIHLALHTLLAHDARKHVVLLDLDGKFDPLRLISVLDARLGGALRSSQGPQLARDACLARFHLLRAHSSHDFLAALCRLDALLQALQPAGGCSLVLVDNIGAFYWQDRASRAWAQTAGPAPSAADMALLAPPMTLQKVTEAVAGRLAALAALHRFVVVATKHVTQVSVQSSAGPGGAGGETRLVPREYLPTSWQNLVSHRLCLAVLPQWQRQQLHVAAGGGGGPMMAGGDRDGELLLAQWQGAAPPSSISGSSSGLITPAAAGPLAQLHITPTALQMLPMR